MNAAIAAEPRLLGAHHEAPIRFTGSALINEVAAAGLTGRGGAGFPTARKLAVVAAGRHPVVIANGAEGEPASAKDRTLLTHAPHLVREGLRLAAAAVGARRTVMYAPAAFTSGFAGRDIEFIAAPDGFVSGEESAVVATVEGRAALPKDTPVRVVTVGVGGAPTLVQNVETLAHIGLIARYGAGWFRSVGSDEEPGTFLATVSGAVRRPGVVEVPRGLPLGAVLEAVGGSAVPLRAVLVGGYHGAWVPADALDAPMTRAGLARFGAAPGAGVVVALSMTRCPLEYAAGVMAYLAGQTAGQCGPCLNGLPRLAHTMRELARRPADRRLAPAIERLTGLVVGRGACQHPDGSARFVTSTLRTFADDIAAHMRGNCVAKRR
jgi:NADH:ubiquinone oxidoreductase subunit F (NADH-binding)